MINFLRENSNIISKMMVNQFGMTVFGFVLSMATTHTHWLLVLTSVFAICFYMFLLYSLCWTYGAQDKIKVDGGRAKYLPYKGMWISLAANAVNIVLGVVTALSYACITDIEAGLPAWATNIYVVVNAIVRITQAMYLGVVRVVIPDIIEPYSFLLTPLPAILICGIAYYLGLKNIRILKIFGIDTTKKNLDNKR